MNAGMSLTDLAKELERQRDKRRDYLAVPNALEMDVEQGGDVFLKVGEDAAPLTEYAHGQLANFTGIPKRYYDRMRRESPALLTRNVNTWLEDEGGKGGKRLVRILDGRVRAVLSDGFRVLDNLELANAVLPRLLEQEATVISSSITETNMYIKAILPRLSDDLPPGLSYGDGHSRVAFGHQGKVVAAIVIANSDVGNGALRVEPSVFTTWCTNLAVMQQTAMRQYHLGRRNGSEEDVALYQNDTREADDRAFFLKVRDTVDAAFSPRMWAEAVAQIRGAAQDPIVNNDIPKVVDAAIKRLGLPEGLNGGIIGELAKGGDLSRWGLSSAITSVAGQVADYEAATLMERVGGRVLSLPQKDWRLISEGNVPKTRHSSVEEVMAV